MVDATPWWKKRPISLKNYDERMAWHGRTIKQYGDNWPFLSNDPDIPATADPVAWHKYFRDHLGGFPLSYRLFNPIPPREHRAPTLRYYNVPETSPELFDPSYNPKQGDPA